jgi:hypothetical protein
MKDISQEELIWNLSEMHEQCKHINSKLLSAMQCTKPLLQRAFIQEAGYHRLQLTKRFNYLEGELIDRRISLE